MGFSMLVVGMSQHQSPEQPKWFPSVPGTFAECFVHRASTTGSWGPET